MSYGHRNPQTGRKRTDRSLVQCACGALPHSKDFVKHVESHEHKRLLKALPEHPLRVRKLSRRQQERLRSGCSIADKPRPPVRETVVETPRRWRW